MNKNFCKHRCELKRNHEGRMYSDGGTEKNHQRGKYLYFQVKPGIKRETEKTSHD